MLIILQIWEQSVIFLNYGVASLVSPKEGSVNIIYPIYYYPLTKYIAWVASTIQCLVSGLVMHDLTKLLGLM